MNLEVETKLSVPSGFSLPIDDLRDLGMLVTDIAIKFTKTIYLDTNNLDLAACGAAVRFRSELENENDGTWTLKFSSPQVSSVVSRFELEVLSPRDHFPPRFNRALRVFGVHDDLKTVATLFATRSSIWFIDDDDNRVVEIDDDVVKVYDNLEKVHTFREIEVEVIDPRYGHFAEQVVGVVLASGARYAKSSSKLEQALAVTMDSDQVSKTFERFSKDFLAQLISIARFVLEDSEGLHEVSEDFYRLIALDLGLDASESLLKFLAIWLMRPSGLDILRNNGARSMVSNILFEYANLIRTTQISDGLGLDLPRGPASDTIEFLVASMKSSPNGAGASEDNVVRNWVDNLIRVLMFEKQDLRRELHELFGQHAF